MLQWILIFYGVPARPVGARIKLWRRVSACGAVPLKDAVYILPHSPENYELCQWLSGEIAAVGGQCGFAVCRRLENISNDELIEVFNRHREKDFQALQRRIFELSERIEGILKGAELSGRANISGGGEKSPAARAADIIKEYERIKAIDFFASARGREVKKRIDDLKSGLKKLSAAKSAKSGKSDKLGKPEAAILKRRAADYAGRTWATRKKPYIDRAASAWLIRRFVDGAAVFLFLDDEVFHKKNPPPGAVTFDARGAEFTHLGDLCTFEVLIKSFGIKDKTVLGMAEVVHDLDIRDDRYTRPETAGVEEIFRGLAASLDDDATLLKRGMEIFEMLYASKSK
jgi:hypothetical protein